jgi:hypothetical protein
MSKPEENEKIVVFYNLEINMRSYNRFRRREMKRNLT